MFCAGVSNHSPEVVLKFLASAGFEQKDVSVVPVGTKLAKNSKRCIFFLCIDDFYANLSWMKKTLVEKEVLVLVLASPIRLQELDGCTPLDFVVSPESLAAFRFTPLNKAKLSRALKAHTLPKRKSSEYLITLMTTVREGSLLSPLMTFIYTLSGAAQQNPVKEAVATYFVDYKTKEWLQDKVKSVLSVKKLTDLWLILESEPAVKIRQVCQAIKKHKGDKTPNIASLCKPLGVQTYEVTYLRATLKRHNPSKEKVVG